MLADLDESAWEVFGPAVCRRLADQVVAIVRQKFDHLPPAVRQQRLPDPGGPLRLADLNLGVRTTNCLRRDVFDELSAARDWTEVTVDHLVRIRDLGPKGLLEFLAAYQSICGVRGSGASVVRHVESELALHPDRLLEQWLADSSRGIPASVRNLPVPLLPSGFDLADLPLQRRTRNRLLKHGLLETGRLSQLTLGELSALRGWGPKSVIDLISTILQARQGRISPPVRPAPPAPPPPPPPPPPRPRCLEEELQQLVAATRGGQQPRNREIVLRYYGLDGRSGTSLRAIGVAHGIARQRVWQICRRVASELEQTRPPTPILDRACRVVERMLPAPAERVQAELQRRGLTRGLFPLESLVRAAMLLGRDCPFEVVCTDS